jgi:paraquat-inducible protein A
VLYQNKRDSLNRTLAFVIAGLILFTVANTFPFLAFQMETLRTQTTLITGVRELYAQGMWELAVVVLLTTVIVPGAQLSGLLYVLLPLKFNRIPPRAAPVFRSVQNLQPWSMMEVLMLGILVSVFKLGKMATIVPGLALWSFGLLILSLAGAIAALDPRIVWERLGSQR